MGTCPRTWMWAPITDRPKMGKEILGSRTRSPKHRDVERNFGVPYKVPEAPTYGKILWGPVRGPRSTGMWKEILGSRTRSPKHLDVERNFGVPYWVPETPGCGKKIWGPVLELRGTGMWKDIVGSRTGGNGGGGRVRLGRRTGGDSEARTFSMVDCVPYIRQAMFVTRRCSETNTAFGLGITP